MLAAGAGLAAAGAVVGTAPAAAHDMPGIGHENFAGSRQTFISIDSSFATLSTENFGTGPARTATVGPLGRGSSVLPWTGPV